MTAKTFCPSQLIETELQPFDEALDAIEEGSCRGLQLDPELVDWKMPLLVDVASIDEPSFDMATEVHVFTDFVDAADDQDSPASVVTKIPGLPPDALFEVAANVEPSSLIARPVKELAFEFMVDQAKVDVYDAGDEGGGTGDGALSVVSSLTSLADDRSPIALEVLTPGLRR